MKEKLIYFQLARGRFELSEGSSYRESTVYFTDGKHKRLKRTRRKAMVFKCFTYVVIHFFTLSIRVSKSRILRILDASYLRHTCVIPASSLPLPENLITSWTFGRGEPGPSISYETKKRVECLCSG